MSIPAKNGGRYRFGPFELDPTAGRLARNGATVKLQDLPYRLLVMLVERPGEIVTREEVRQCLWPENTFVEFDNSLGVAIRKVRDSLGDDAEAPRYVETIPRRGYRFLAPVTVQGAAEAATPAMAGEKEVAPASPADLPVGLRRPIRRYWVVAALVLLLVGTVIYEFHSVPGRASTNAEGGSVAPRVRIRRSVAVMGFRNLPGRAEDNWLSAAFAEMLNTELAAGGDLRLVSGEDVARAKRELPLTDEDSLAKATLARLRKDPGADVVVVGSYTALPGNGTTHIRLDIRIQDTAAGETIAEDSVTGSESDLFDMAHRAGVHLRQSLGVVSLSPENVVLARASLPSNPSAVRLYTEGRARLWAFDFLHARDLLVRAVLAEPEYPLAHSALSEAWERLGYEPKARAEAQRAVELSGHLSQEEHLAVEGQYRKSIRDWPKAVETYRSLFDLFPDSLDYGLNLAQAQRWVKPADSLQTLAILRLLPAPAGEDPRIDLVEAASSVSQDVSKAQAAANRAIAKGRALGSHLIVGRAYGYLCQQGNAIGVAMEEIKSDCENAIQSDAAAGDRNTEARALNDLAGIYFFQGDLARAEAMWRKSEAEFRQSGDPEGIAASLNNLGDIALLRGDLPAAEKLLRESIPSYQAIEDKDGLALALNDLGDLARREGNLETAVTTYQQAKATAQEIDDKNAVAYVLTGMGDVLTDRGDLAAARKSYEESLSMRTQSGEKQIAAETQVALAQLLIEEGQPAEAEATARKCEDQFHREQEADDELAAIAVLAEALLAQGKQAEAARKVESAAPMAAKNQNTMVRLRFDLISARVTLASDKPELAGTRLRQTLDQARKHQYLGVEFEASLALAELDIKSGHAASGRAQLVALEKAARGKGFGLVAGKAATSQSGTKIDRHTS
jgi:DNA-binding winged helix-turn-helix (wHTH) protein/tetratricopeptide (TPR) repeat protein